MLPSSGFTISHSAPAHGTLRIKRAGDYSDSVAPKTLSLRLILFKIFLLRSAIVMPGVLVCRNPVLAEFGPVTACCCNFGTLKMCVLLSGLW
jgi:hypothetical protein